MDLQDGIYFGMSEEIYHKLPRFSSSGVKDMAVSELDYWTNSWLNPENSEPKEEDPRDSMFKLKGRAYHCRVIEGLEAFKSRYTYSLDPAAYKGKVVLVTAKDIERELKAMGVKGYSGLNKAELVKMILLHAPFSLVWDHMEETHQKKNAGKTMLPHEWFMDIEVGAAMIEKQPTLKHAFIGGFAEVAILWTKEVEDEDGSGRIHKVPMKCKIDRLKPRAIVDYKTFGNARRKRIKYAITGAMAEQKNHIQVAVYYDAADHIAEFIKAGKFFFPEGVELPIAKLDEVAELAKHDKVFFFVFQQTGRSPVAKGRTMPRNMTMVDIGRIEYETAARKFAKCFELFGTDRWVVDEDVEQFEDTDFPAWMAN